jgi:guanylate kinase
VVSGTPARLTVLSGPSGVGKGTVVSEVRRRHPDVWVSVSVTTRRPRPGEREGDHYHFVDDAEFDRLIAADGLLEWAEYAGNRYGTPVAPLHTRLATGQPALLEIELQGARQVRARDPEAQLVFLAPPSWAALVSRLAGRGSEPPAVQERRLALAQAELDASGEFDVVVVNDDVARAADELVALLTAPSPGLVPGE